MDNFSEWFVISTLLILEKKKNYNDFQYKCVQAVSQIIFLTMFVFRVNIIIVTIYILILCIIL